MTSNKTVAAPIVKALVEVLIGLDIPATKFCRDLGIDAAILNSPHDRISELDYAALMQMARSSSDIPDLALQIGERFLPSALGIYGFSMITADSMREIVKRSQKYQHHISNSLKIDISRNENNYEISFVIDAPTSEITDFIMDFSMAQSLNATRWILGNKNMQPVAVYLTRPKPENLTDYEKFFQCPLHFNHSTNILAVSKQDFERPSPSRNKQLDEINEYELQRIVASSGEQSLSQLVKEQIISLFHTGDVSMETIARYFNISERTLLRRLKEEGFTFLELVDQTRKFLAKHHIEKTESSFQEITFALGFKDSSTFYRAFKRWYGQTPSQFRQQRPALKPPTTNKYVHYTNTSL